MSALKQDAVSMTGQDYKLNPLNYGDDLLPGGTDLCRRDQIDF
jgi:hypothetical protein